MIMAKILNPGLRPIPLPTGHVVPRQGELVTTNDVLRCADNVAFLRGQELSGALTLQFDPDPVEPPEAPKVAPTLSSQPESPAAGKSKG
ncbi:MAG: hypothetical protein BGP11_18420 [Rhodobacterales bacterium 65-51]|nr:MAG: hypothetical protein BGP11_18420 [Rhodobacterales bacterium 65-51]